MSHRLNIAFFGSSLLAGQQNPWAAYYRGLIRALSEHGHRVTFYEPKTADHEKPRDTVKPHWVKVVAYAPTDESALDALERAEQSDLIIKCSGTDVCDDLLDAAVLELKKPETLVCVSRCERPRDARSHPE